MQPFSYKKIAQAENAVALVALDAVVQTRGPNGERSIPLADFHLVPGDTPERETVLQHGSLIVAVDLPALNFAKRWHYLKVRDRASYAFAMASVAAVRIEQTYSQSRLPLHPTFPNP